MAFDIERSRILADAKAGTQALADQASAVWGKVWPVVLSGAHRARRLVSKVPIVRWFSRSLVRRIVFSNVVGLLILLVGYLMMNQYKDWLVDAKVDSLTAQGEIIAQAIAANVTLDGERIVLDPEALPDKGI